MPVTRYENGLDNSSVQISSDKLFFCVFTHGINRTFSSDRNRFIPSVKSGKKPSITNNLIRKSRWGFERKKWSSQLIWPWKTSIGQSVERRWIEITTNRAWRWHGIFGTTMFFLRYCHRTQGERKSSMTARKEELLGLVSCKVELNSRQCSGC